MRPGTQSPGETTLTCPGLAFEGLWFHPEPAFLYSLSAALVFSEQANKPVTPLGFAQAGHSAWNALPLVPLHSRTRLLPLGAFQDCPAEGGIAAWCSPVPQHRGFGFVLQLPSLCRQGWLPEFPALAALRSDGGRSGEAQGAARGCCRSRWEAVTWTVVGGGDGDMDTGRYCGTG